MVKQLHPNARDAAQSRVNRLTVGIIAASIAGTLGLGAGIAMAAPPPKQNNKTDYGQKSKTKPATTPTKNGQPQTNDKPESSSGDEQTTSGGS
ncbi:MAG TPA: hypothetical protein VGX25_13255 [Actinophytocola sp.]|uniref:hypothetical protein n=1 Tax=Actinophytocola sp. TaxID=1872138 RepID=UPI002DDD00E9|nr:hypothetical protein [Actinophytocola sp.]HEV2780352.1 hypothetical protein [Actinophytocola sp.]